MTLPDMQHPNPMVFPTQILWFFPTHLSRQIGVATAMGGPGGLCFVQLGADVV